MTSEKSQQSGPADTRMMGIVHRAMRRDLVRAGSALTQEPVPSEPQRKAIAAQLLWITRFLQHHHAGEDAGLFPMLRDRLPDAAALLSAMDAGHASIEPQIVELERAATDYGRSDSTAAREGVLAAILGLQEVLLPHLQREEEELMPLASAAITAAEWAEWDQQHNLKPKSFAQLGREGHWLLDGLDADDRQIVVGLVPPVPRFILVHGFARSYRRLRSRCWGAAVGPGGGVQKSGRVQVLVDAAPDRVMDVAVDVTRVGEWSHECRGAAWLGGATRATPGARFRGRNRAGWIRWGRLCEIVTVEPRKLVWRTVPTLLSPDSAEWTIAVDEAADGTSIVQSYQMLKIPKFLDRAYVVLIPGHRDRNAALAEDLRRLGALAARDRDAQPVPVSWVS